MINFFNVDNLEFMRSKPDGFYDLAIIDPPYGLKRVGEKRKTPGRIQGDSDCNEKLMGWKNYIPDKVFFSELFRVTKNQIIWGANNFVLPPTEYFCIWNKHQTVDNFASAEYAWVSMGLKTPAKVFDYSIHKHNHTDKIHPTEKPVDLYRWILQIYAKEGWKLLDTHGGSMSIAIAADMEGFDLDITEIDKEYFQSATNRYLEYKRQLKLF